MSIFHKIYVFILNHKNKYTERLNLSIFCFLWDIHYLLFSISHKTLYLIREHRTVQNIEEPLARQTKTVRFTVHGNIESDGKDMIII